MNKWEIEESIHNVLNNRRIPNDYDVRRIVQEEIKHQDLNRKAKEKNYKKKIANQKYYNNKENKNNDGIKQADSMNGVNCNESDTIEQTSELNDNHENNDFEQRRSNRLGAIIGILAAIGAILIFVFNFLINAINMWPLQGYSYQYVQILMVIVVTSIILIIFRAVTYCYYDLKRHNIKDKDYKKYDIISDEKFSLIIEEVEICLSLLAFTLYALLPIQKFSENSKMGKISGGLLVIIPTIIAIAVIYYKRKHILNSIIANIKRVGYTVILGIFVYYIGFLLVVIKDATISIDYNVDGNVKIINVAGEYTEFNIYIYELDSNKLVWMNIIEDTDVHKAREVIKINNTVSDIKGTSEGVLLKSEILYSSCKINLDDIKDILMNKEYCIVITSEQEGKSVQIINTFTKDEGYAFTQDRMTKKY